MSGNYIIVGDTERFNDCLVTVVYGGLEDAKRVLDRMLNNPNEHDKQNMKGHKNFRIEFCEAKNCWWNDPVLCN